MLAAFADRLADAVRQKNSTLVVGLDPVPDRLPRALLTAAERRGDDARQLIARGIENFDEAVIELVAPFAVAVKPQIAFYELWGPPGLAAYERAVRTAKAAGLLVIGDIKRGDIGSTATAYAEAYLGNYSQPELPSGGSACADAVTVNPYLGSDSVRPFIDVARRESAGLFVLVRTSNPSAHELQSLVSGGRPLDEHVASLVTEWRHDMQGDCGYSSIGAVVGATAPRDMARPRACLPTAWFLVPGVGAQGAHPQDVAPGFGRDGLGLIVNSSRSILYAYETPDAADWKSPIREAARTLRDDLRLAAAATPR